jgi:hypothetical protein
MMSPERAVVPFGKKGQDDEKKGKDGKKSGKDEGTHVTNPS